MPDSATTGFITKTEAARIYRRSERSISRDITNAVKFGEVRVLQHVELRLENGTRRPGTELTIEEVVKLRDRGLNPTWFLDTDWLKSNYGRRDEPAPAEAMTETFDSRPATGERESLPENLDQRVAVLAAQNDALRQSNVDLRAQAIRLEKELDRHAEERREETELQKQNNVLMQQVYNMLSKMQESAGQVTVLPAPRPNAAVIEDASEDADATLVVDGKGTQPPSTKTPVSDTRAKRSKKRGRKSQTAATSQPEPKPAPTKVSKYLPTLDRAVRSWFRK